MARINIAVATSQKPAAAGSVAGGFRFDIGGGAIDNPTPVAVFNDVPEGTYVATCVALGADGNPLQPAADFTFSQTFDVPAETVMLDAPVGMTINVTLGAAGAATATFPAAAVGGAGLSAPSA